MRGVFLLCLAWWAGCGQPGDADLPAGREGEIAQGRQLFIANGCYLCHGEEGHGDGQLARTLTPRPRDFRELSAYKRGPELEQLEETIQKGLGTGQGIMPAYPHLSAEERRRLALFIQSIQSQP